MLNDEIVDAILDGRIKLKKNYILSKDRNRPGVLLFEILTIIDTIPFITVYTSSINKYRYYEEFMFSRNSKQLQPIEVRKNLLSIIEN